MKTRNLVFLVVLVALCAIGTNAYNRQWNPINIGDPITGVTLSPSDSVYLEGYRHLSHERQIALAWLHVKGRNSYSYPNPDLVMPGDTLLIPLGNYYVARSGGTDHMWNAAALFVAKIVRPYLDGVLPVVVPTPTVDSSTVSDTMAAVNTHDGLRIPWWGYVLLGLILLGIALFAWYNSRSQRHNEETATSEREQYERSLKFVPDPPSFKKAADDEVVRTADEAAKRAFGRGVQVIGPVERGYISGEQQMFNANGTHRFETFANEPGYRARVRFANGTERLVVCRWACFNPVYSLADAEFTGTFRPEGSSVAQEIPRISGMQTSMLYNSINGSEREFTADDLPDTTDGHSQEASKPATTSSTPGKHSFTKLMVSKEKGLTAEGDIQLSTNELYNVLYQVTGRHPNDLKKGNKPSNK